MNSVDTVRAFWERMEARDWSGVRSTLADDVVVEWPETNERFVGAENVVAVNAQYPEGWAIRVLRLVGESDLVVAEVEVPHQDMGIFRVAAFMEVADAKIVHSVEYWVGVGGSEPPAWRVPYAERMAGK